MGEFEDEWAEDGYPLTKKKETFTLSVNVDDAAKYRMKSASSDNKKVATISKKSNGLVKITLKGDGDVTLKCKYEYKYDGDDDWESTEDVIDLKVVDLVAKKAVAFWGEPEDWEGWDAEEKDAHKSSSTITISDLGEYDENVVIPFTVNGAGKICDYEDDEDVDDNALGGTEFKYRWSNKDVLCFEDGERSGTESQMTIGSMKLLAKKPGKSNLTLTDTLSNKSVTLKFKVDKVHEYKGENAKKNPGHVTLAVKKAEWKDYDTLKFTVSINNRSGKKLDKKTVRGVTIIGWPDPEDEYEFDGNLKIEKAIKDKGTGTGTMEVSADYFDLDDVNKFMVDVSSSSDALSDWIGDFEPKANGDF
jgi:DNA-binding protein YbaB